MTHKGKMRITDDFQESSVFGVICSRRILALDGRTGNQLPGADQWIYSRVYFSRFLVCLAGNQDAEKQGTGCAEVHWLYIQKGSYGIRVDENTCLFKNYICPSKNPKMAELLYYFLKLNPPPASFTVDMTAEEPAVTLAHVQYRMPFVQDGTAVVLGPVAGPKGGYRVAIVGFQDQSRLDELVARDPANGLCSNEIHPMRAVTRQPK
jgi:hypothetical protein